MKNLILLVLIVSVSVLVSGCRESNEARNLRLVNENDLPNDGFTALKSSISQEFNTTNFRIKSVTRPNKPDLLRDTTDIPEAQESEEFWCVELDFGVNSGARDYEVYLGRNDDEYVMFGVLSGTKNRDEWWDEFGC